jgi:hypothetical protein
MFSGWLKKNKCSPCSVDILSKNQIPNSEFVGFQSLGPGTGDTKMHAPKNRSSLGTLLEPFAVGLQSWDNVIADIHAPMDLRQGKKNEKIKVVLGTEELFPAIYWKHFRIDDFCIPSIPATAGRG